MRTLFTSHNTIKYHVRVNRCDEERLELLHVKLRLLVAWTPTCTMLPILPLCQPYTEQVSTVAPLDYLGCLLLKFIDEAIVDGLQGRSLLHYTCSDLGLDVFQGGLDGLFLLLFDGRRLLFVEMCWVLSYRGL